MGTSRDRDLRRLKVGNTVYAHIGQALVVGVLLSAAAPTAEARTHRSVKHAHARRGHKPARRIVAVAVPAPRTLAPAVPCLDVQLIPTPENLSRVNRAVICLVNAARIARRLPALVENPALDLAATRHSQDMVAGDYFDHVSPGGETPQARVLATGYVPGGRGYGLAENIALEPTGGDSAEQTVAAWLGEAGHRANLLDPAYRDTGVGSFAAIPPSLGQGLEGTVYTQEFAYVAAAG